MPTDRPQVSRPLPEHPNLRHLKDQAKDLLKAGDAASLTEAQFKIARMYGFASWAKLKAHVDSLEEVGQLKQAIDTNDFARVKALMTRNPELHRAPLGYGKNGPLTWVAECRVPWEPPTPQRLAMAEWMIDHGSDVHQGGDGPLMRAALLGDRIPMMELLIANGADVSAEWNGYFPVIFSPCETVDPVALQWLLDHGANPNCARLGRKYPGTAVDYVIQSYWRTPELATCIDILLAAGATTKYDVPVVLDILRSRLNLLAGHLDARSFARTPMLSRTRLRRHGDAQIDASGRNSVAPRSRVLQCGNGPILAQSWSRGERPRDHRRCGHWRPNSAFPFGSAVR